MWAGEENELISSVRNLREMLAKIMFFKIYLNKQNKRKKCNGHIYEKLSKIY